MVPALGAVAVDGWISYRDSGNTATVVQDRLPLGSARIIAEQLHMEDRAFRITCRRPHWSCSNPTEIDGVYYRVTTGGADRHWLPELALPGGTLSRRRRSSSTRWCAVRRARSGYLQPVLADRQCGRCS
jgi:two-component system sensor histidine kinase TctE